MEPYRNTDDYENAAEQEVASINILKRFVETTIAEEREAFAAKVEGMRKSVGLGLAEDLHSVNDYNAALNDVLSALKELN